jgi:hypothetical protein
MPGTLRNFQMRMMMRFESQVSARSELRRQIKGQNSQPPNRPPPNSRSRKAAGTEQG